MVKVISIGIGGECCSAASPRSSLGLGRASSQPRPSWPAPSGRRTRSLQLLRFGPELLDLTGGRGDLARSTWAPRRPRACPAFWLTLERRRSRIPGSSPRSRSSSIVPGSRRLSTGIRRSRSRVRGIVRVGDERRNARSPRPACPLRCGCGTPVPGRRRCPRICGVPRESMKVNDPLTGTRADIRVRSCSAWSSRNRARSGSRRPDRRRPRLDRRRSSPPMFRLR